MVIRSGTNVADRMDGGYESDELYGLQGSDIINGGYGADYLYGDRSYWYEKPTAGAADTIRGGYNNDEIHGDHGDDFLYGDSGDDKIYGGAGRDLLSGGTGNDRLYVGVGAEITGDRVEGGYGIDLLTVDFSALTTLIQFVPLDPNALYTVAGFSVKEVEQYWLTGSKFNDTLYGWLHDDTIYAGEGADAVRGLGGNDTIYGHGGADIIYGGAGADFIRGDDYATPGFADRIWGEDGHDSIDGNAGDDQIVGGNGNDSLSGSEGIDVIYGDAGNDSIYGGIGADRMIGGLGDDEMASQNWLYAVRGGDPGAEKDNLDAGDGNDGVLIGVGDTAKGGLGTDTLRLDMTSSAIAVNYSLTAALVTLANGTIIDGFEILEFAGGGGGDVVNGGVLRDWLYGGLGNDTLGGNAGNDWLDGEDGNDTVNGGLGDDTLEDSGTATGIDTLNGGADRDTITGRGGADRLNGEAGNDTLYTYDDAFAADIVNGGADTDTFSFWNSWMSVYLDLTNQTLNDGAAKNDRFSLIEFYEGTVYDDFMYGDAAANTFDGRAGDDWMEGRDGNDRLIGGFGSDILHGGNGVDTFVLEAGNNGTYWPADIIRDFLRGTDKLEISATAFGENVTFSASGGVSSGGAAPHLHFDTSNGRLWYDPDGIGTLSTPTLIATLEKLTTLATTDFVFG
jgi:Ca2+-binding RTX toxin-like protein